MKKFIAILLTLTSIALMFSGCGYFSYNKYYIDLSDYYEIWNLSGLFYYDYEKSPLFPDDIENKNVQAFFCRHDEQFPLGEGVQIYLQVQYNDAQSYDEELERLSAISEDCKEYFEDLDFSVALATSICKEGYTEYALVDSQRHEIFYIYVDGLPIDQIEFDHELLPLGYGDYGYLEQAA